jgi:hypothetical protein
LGLGVRVATKYAIDVDHDDWPFAAKVAAHVESGRLIATVVTFRARDGERAGVNADGLRSLPIGEVLRRALAAGTRFASTPDPIMSADPSELGQEERLRRAAVVYRLAALEGEKATNAVATDLGVSRATAGRLVARARDDGFLGAAIGPLAGEEA